MSFYYILIVILIIFIVISLVLNLLSSPFTWIIIIGLFVWSWIRRFLYAKQLEDYNKEFTKRTKEKKEYYYNQEPKNTSQRVNTDDVIDVNYTVIDEENEE